MCLGVLREAVGIEGGASPESIANFHIPSSVSVAAYRSTVSYLMETHRCEYMQLDREEGDLHPRYHEQWDTLIHGVVSEGVTDSGAHVSVLNRDKVYQLLKTHQTKTFQQGIIAFVRSVEEKVSKPAPQCLFYSMACMLLFLGTLHLQALPIPACVKVTHSHQRSMHNPAQQQQNAPTRYSNPARSDLKAPPPIEEPVVSAPVPEKYETTKVDADAAFWAEAKRKDIEGRRKISFGRAFLDALVEKPLLPTDSGFEEYWQGEGWVNGIHYTRSWYYDEDMYVYFV